MTDKKLSAELVSFREKIAARFSADELTTFCSDHFPSVSNELMTGMPKSQVIQILLAHSVRNQCIMELLDALEAERPGIVPDRLTIIEAMTTHFGTARSEERPPRRATTIKVPRTATPEELEELWQQAERAYREQNWEEADRLLNEVAEVNPRYKEVQRLRSRMKRNLELLAEYRRICALDDSKWREAKAAFERIRAENPRFADTHQLLHWIEGNEWCELQYDLAADYSNNGEYAKSVEVLHRILGRYPSHRKARDWLEAELEALEEEQEFARRRAEPPQSRAPERRTVPEPQFSNVGIGMFVIFVLALLIVCTVFANR